jgi:hypothetical protein
MMKINKTLSLHLIVFIGIFSVFHITLAKTLLERVLGRIVLQVESRGEAWYVDPVTETRSYLADGNAAYELLRDRGLGITNENLASIPIGLEPRFEMLDSDQDTLPDKLEEAVGTNSLNQDSDGDGYLDGDEIINGYNPSGTERMVFDDQLREQLSGRILLQVESRGEAWYVYPEDNKRYYLADGQVAYEIMRFLGLGISDNDLSQIPLDPDEQSFDPRDWADLINNEEQTDKELSLFSDTSDWEQYFVDQLPFLVRYPSDIYSVREGQIRFGDNPLEDAVFFEEVREVREVDDLGPRPPRTSNELTTSLMIMGVISENEQIDEQGLGEFFLKIIPSLPLDQYEIKNIRIAGQDALHFTVRDPEFFPEIIFEYIVFHHYFVSYFIQAGNFQTDMFTEILNTIEFYSA